MEFHPELDPFSDHFSVETYGFGDLPCEDVLMLI